MGQKLLNDKDGLRAKIVDKIEKERGRVKTACESAPDWKPKTDFTVAERETKKITGKTRVSQAVYSAVVSRFDVRKLSPIPGKYPTFTEGKTTIDEILKFYFPPLKKKGKKQKKGTKPKKKK
jgi:hypothetical protein